MKPAHKKIISFGILIIFAALAAYYVMENVESFRALQIVNPGYIVVLAVITFLVSASNGLITKAILEPFGIKLRVKEWVGLSIITTFYNTITPFKGGMFARAAYLKKKHNFSITNFFATYVGIYVISFFVYGLIGLTTVWLIYTKYKIFNPIVFFIFLGMFIILGLVMLFRPRFKEFENRLLNKISEVANGWNVIRQSPKVIGISIEVILIQISLGVLATLLSYSIFGIEITFIQSLFLVSIGTIVGLIQITPGNLGIGEAVAVFSALIINITPAQSLSVALLGRAVSLIVLFILGTIFSYVLLKNGEK